LHNQKNTFSIEVKKKKKFRAIHHWEEKPYSLLYRQINVKGRQQCPSCQTELIAEEEEETSVAIAILGYALALV